ncbi:MAG: ATP-binding protein [Deltaproteobacteria bacterium]|nr:ATP-binding protein [Deltaproteobacteria bacterium]
MADNSKYPEYLTSPFRWLMLARVMIVTFLLGLATFIEIMKLESQSAISVSILFNTILLTYILSIIYLLLPKYLPNIITNIYIQSICDIALVTAMVYATGGVRSIYSVFYPLVVIYSVIFLARKGGFIIASIAGIFYGCFADLEFYGMIYPFFADHLSDYPLNAGYVFTRIITHILSFYLIAFLASFVVEQERKTRTLLAEKQGAFEQLGLLHQSIIESVDTGILTVNLNGQIKSFNRAATEITGLSFREIENRKLSDFFIYPPPLQSKFDENGQRSLTKTRFETAFITSEMKRLILGGSVSPLRDPSGVMIGNIIVFQDLTTINEMKESLEKSRRLAFIGEMAAGLAHEIRNPLASIGGSIQMLRGDFASNETNARLMQIILRGKDQLESFLKDFLLIARPAPGIRELLDIRETIREVIESLRCVADWNDRLDLVMSLTDEPLNIRANKMEIRQALWNLILNAVQAMPEGGLLKIEGHLARYGAREGIEINIGDTGVGIRMQDFEKIFEPFYTTRETGTGLGLAVVSRITEAYGGKIHMQSESGKGTRFTIWLPAIDT